MNKKGFTLAELLGVIIVLGALVLVVATPIVSQINKQKVKLDDSSLKLIYSTTETYIDKNKNSYPLKNNAVYYITLKQLLDSKFIEGICSISTEVFACAIVGCYPKWIVEIFVRIIKIIKQWAKIDTSCSFFDFVFPKQSFSINFRKLVFINEIIV